jgi:hypothetical protein
MKRWAKSYSIIDHALLHGGYLRRLGHRALALYLFYAVVGDAEGRNFYSAKTITDILRLSFEELAAAKRELSDSGLIESCGRDVWVKNLSYQHDTIARPCRAGSAHEGRNKTFVPADRGGTWHTPLEVLEAVLLRKGGG